MVLVNNSLYCHYCGINSIMVTPDPPSPPLPIHIGSILSTRIELQCLPSLISSSLHALSFCSHDPMSHSLGCVLYAAFLISVLWNVRGSN